MTAGIYMIECTATGRRYVGSSVRMQKRMSHHRKSFNKRDATSKLLQNEYDAHGPAAFAYRQFCCILPNSTVEDLLLLERLVCEQEKPELNTKVPDLWANVPLTRRLNMRATPIYAPVAPELNLTQLARELGVHRRTLRRRLKAGRPLVDPPKQPKTRDRAPVARIIEVNGVRGWIDDVRRANGVGKKLYARRRREGMDAAQAIAAGPYVIQNHKSPTP